MTRRVLRASGSMVLVLALTTALAAAERFVVRVGDPDAERPFSQHPTVAATDEGFAVLWVSDVRAKHRSFARFGADGAPLAPPREIDDSGRGGSIRADHRLLDAQGGFVAYARRGGLWAVALGLDAAGTPTGPESVLFEVVDDQELFGLSAARNANSFLTVRSQWALVGTLVAERTDRDGRPVGPEKLVHRGGTDGSGFSSIRMAPVAPLESGFGTAWITEREALTFRALTRVGAPTGEIVDLTPSEDRSCLQDVHVATAGEHVAVVYVAGCLQLDILARSRRADGAWSDPYPVADASFDEGPPWLQGTSRGVRVAGAGDRFGVLFATLPAGRRAPARWSFVEVGFDGVALGPPIDVLDAIAMDPVGEVDLVWDRRRGRYLLAWAGGGPDGQGVHVAAWPAAPR